MSYDDEIAMARNEEFADRGAHMIPADGTPTSEALARALDIHTPSGHNVCLFQSDRQAVALALDAYAAERERAILNAALSLFYGGTSDTVRMILEEEILADARRGTP